MVPGWGLLLCSQRLKADCGKTLSPRMTCLLSVPLPWSWEVDAWSASRSMESLLSNSRQKHRGATGELCWVVSPANLHLYFRRRKEIAQKAAEENERYRKEMEQ